MSGRGASAHNLYCTIRLDNRIQRLKVSVGANYMSFIDVQAHRICAVIALKNAILCVCVFVENRFCSKITAQYFSHKISIFNQMEMDRFIMEIIQNS